MAESELGVATLRIVADTREALAALETLRAAVGRGVGDTGNFFSGIEQQARNAGESAARAISTALRGASAGISFNGIESQAREAGVRASRALRSAVTSNATNTRLSFGNIDEALGFAQALSGTVDDLREYRTALQSLRDGTSAAAPGFSQLNNAIAEIGQTIRNFSSSSNELTGSLTRNREAAVSPELRELAALYGRLEGGSRRAAIAQAELARDTSAVGASTEVATRRVQTFAQVLSQIPGASLESINRQIASLQEGLGGLSIRSQEFLQRLTGIAELEIIRDNRLNRQRANANFNAFSTARVGPDAFGGLPELPPTVAGDLQLIDELNQRLRNVDQSSAEFEITQRALEQTQRRVQQALSGTSASFRELQQAEERAIRRREKLAGIQQYYADLNPRGGGVRDDSGALLARGANSASDERAYRAALGASRELLENDLARLQVLRQISQRILETAAATKGGFGSASASGFGTNDPVQKSIRRNAEKREKVAERAAKQEETYAQQMSQQEQDLAAVRAKRLAAERKIALAAERTALIVAKNREQFGSLPVSGRLPGGSAVPGSPAFKADGQAALQALQKADADFLGRLQRSREDRRRRISDATGSAIIGGAFPALFGQGLGASVGGGVGGAAGGLLGGQFGFGLSLVGTALGAAFDAASERAKTLAKALDSPISQFQALADAALLSSKVLEKQVASLISVGREAEAGALIQRDLISSYGSLDAAQENIKVTDELNRAWSRLTTGMIGFVNGPVKLLAQRLENDFQRNRNVGIEKALRDAGLGNRADALRRDSTNPILASDTAQIAAINDRYASELPAVKAATAALESARRTRQQILDLQLRQTAASVRDNTVLQAGVELDLIRLREREKLQQLRADGKLFTETSPGVYELSPEAKRAQEEAASQRRQLAENAAASAERSARELRNARQLIGLEGERLTIKQEQQKVDEAQRLFAEADRTFRQKYSGADPAKLVGAEKEAYDTLFNARLAAENNLTRIRLQSYEQIQRAEERISLSRQAVEDRIRNAQKGRGLSGLGRGVLDDISAFRQQAAAVSLLTQRSQGDPNNTALAEQAKDARRNLTAAGEDLRNKMFDAFRTAQDAVRNISRSFENAQLSLAELQNTRGQGVNKYLNPQQVTQRQELLNPILQARATEAINKFQNRTGIQVPTQVVTGTLEQRNAQFIDIERQFNNETQALEDLTTAQIDLATATRDLNTVIGGLRDIGAPLTDAINANSTAVNALALKNWEVNVNVQAPPAFIPSPG